MGRIFNRTVLYSDQLDKNSNNTVSEVITSEKDIIHNQFYNSALERFIQESGIDENSYHFKEIRQKEYDQPSYVCMTSKTRPYRKTNIWLNSYWDQNWFKPELKSNLSYITEFIEDPTEITSLEIKSIDYVNGKAELYSRYSGKTLTISLDEVPDWIKRMEGFSLDETFSYKINNKIYGR